MKPSNREEPELYLLLEDYGKRRSSGPAVVTDWGPEVYPLQLLLDDYGSRPKPPGAIAEIPPAPHAPELRLLSEDFDPVRRYREQFPDGAPDLAPLAGEPLDFEVHWDSKIGRDLDRRKAASFAVHAALIAFLVAQPYQPRPHELTERQVDQPSTNITLLAPSAQEIEALTRSEPDSTGETKVFRGREESEAPAIVVPEPTPQPAPQPRPTPPIPVVEEEPEPAPAPQIVEEKPPTVPEPPEPAPVEVAANATPAPGEFQRGKELARRPNPRELPAPRAPKPKEEPKLVLEDPKAVAPSEQGPVELAKLGINTRPDQVIQSAIENMQQSGGGRQAVGEGVGAGRSGGYSPPSPGNIGSGLELLSDPKGVDFRPYLIQVLNAVRRNWYAVLPESARLGLERGRVAIQFSIDRTGGVPKLVIADASGSQPLDRASVAGISASLPFPPLPEDFSGDQIRLQLVFLYNMKR